VSVVVVEIGPDSGRLDLGCNTASAETRMATVHPDTFELVCVVNGLGVVERVLTLACRRRNPVSAPSCE
jgi:hypothetical protein